MNRHKQGQQATHQALARRYLGADRLAELEGQPFNRAYALGLCWTYSVPQRDIDHVLETATLRELYVLSGRPDPGPGPWWRRILRRAGMVA